MPNKKKISLLSSESIKDSMLMFTENADFGETENLSISEIELVDAEVTEGESGEKKKAIKARIKAIHAGRTDNQHIFASEKLAGDEKLGTGAYSFTKPYNKPMLTHHDTYSDAVGRIIAAEYVEDAKGSIEIEVLVTDSDAIEKVKDGRYNTVSIGCRTNSAKCNICGTDRMEEWCEHRRGVDYDGVVCGWLLGDLWFHECSFVNVPADKEAVTLSWEEVDFEKYSLNQEDESGKTIDESSEGTIGIAASEDIEHSEDTEGQGEGDNSNDGNNPENGSEEGEASTTEGTETPCIISEGFDFDGRFASLDEEIKGMKTQFIQFSEAFNSHLESVVKEKDAEISRNYNTINQSSKMIESMFGGLKSLYERLSGYTDAKVESYDLTWGLEQTLEKINSILDTIETESALQADYSQKIVNTKTVEENFSTESLTKSNEDNIYRLLSPKYMKK